MRLHLLKPIQSDDNLAALFNAYMRKLHTMETLSTPLLSMAEYNQLLQEACQDNPGEEATLTLHYCLPHFFQLAALGISLRDLHAAVLGALSTLDGLFEHYDGDLHRYAVETRLRVIDEHGSDDATDWLADGFGEDLQPKWKVAHKDDEASLAPYRFQADLAYYFVGSDHHGEHIGSSQATDFALFSAHVAEAASFNPFKLFRQTTGTHLPMYRADEQGNMVEQTMADEIESELNADLRNQAIIAYFTQALTALQHAAGLHAAATSPEHYQELRELLANIRDMSLGEAFTAA